jgi:trigger factor
MNVTLNKIDPVNATITVDVAKSDYADIVEKSLKDLRKNAVISGFRKGMVPSSRIRQMYGKSVLLEELNKLVIDHLYEYIRNEKVHVLGEPLPSEEQKSINFDTQEDFSFVFDLGLSPEINIQLDKTDKLPYYKIKVTDEMVDKQIENYKANYGSYEEAEETEEKDLIKGTLTELNENGEANATGIYLENAALMPSFMKEETEKAKFIQAKLNATIVFNPYKAYEGNEAELSSFLKIKKEEVQNYTGDFSLQILEISRYKEAEINQELFDKVFEPGTITTEEDFRKKITETVENQFKPQLDYRFIIDVREYLPEKVGDLQLPDTFLKRWLQQNSPDRTPESIEADYPKIVEDLKFQLIWNYLTELYEIKVEEEDIKEAAKQATKEQFEQYGMSNIPDQLLENYSQEMLKKEESIRNLADKALESKMIAVLKQKVSLKSKTVTIEGFQKLFEPKKEKTTKTKEQE